MNNCINNTIVICNNLYNYCKKYCVNNNVCNCSCLDDKINYDKLCVNNDVSKSPFNLNLLIFIILGGCCVFITCWVRVWLANREIRNERINNEPYVPFFATHNGQVNSDSISVLNNSTGIDDSDDLPQYDQLEHNELLPEYCVIYNVNPSSV
jgi:hypothetical protein